MKRGLRQRRPTLAGLALALGCTCAAGEEADAPPDPALRPFGYVLGDVLEQRLAVPVPPGFVLDPGSLPQSGRADNWLELRGVTAEAAGETLTLLASYQLINAPKAVHTLFLPAHRLVFRRGAETREVRVGEQPFTAGPLTPERVLARAGLDELRPDTPPPRLETAATRHRLVAYAAVGAAALAWLAWSYALAPLLAARRHPFAAALRALHRLRRHAPQPLPQQAWRAALQAVHRALDGAAGRSLSLGEVDVWLADDPRYTPLRAGVESFFQRSREEFFGAGTAAADRRLEPLLALCRAGREAELAGRPARCAPSGRNAATAARGAAR